MRRPDLLPVVLFSVTGVVLLFAGSGANSAERSTVERGKYLVMVGGCNDCHSPKVFPGTVPVPDPSRLLSGFPSSEKLPETPKGILGRTRWGALTTNDMTAWVGPGGVSFAANLTPDPRTGMGSRSEGVFVKALKTGKSMGTAREILPPMPWQSIGQMSDADLKAIFAYLTSLPPIDNAVPNSLPPGN